jgi:hypothetical protein
MQTAFSSFVFFGTANAFTLLMLFCGGAYADNKQDYNREECGRNIRHSELGLPWVRRKNGRT